MTICRYFQRGACKFGDQCRFEHTTGGGRPAYPGNSGNYYNNQYSYSPNNQYAPAVDAKSDNRNVKPAVLNPAVTFNDFVITVCEDVKASEIGKQWPLSCYQPRKESDNYPGLDDVSPEELRHEAYQAQLNGTNDTYVWNVERMYKIQHELCQSIKSHSPEAIKILTNIFNGTMPQVNANPISQSLFGQTLAPASSVSASSFSFSLPDNDPPPPQPSLFGQTTTSSWSAAQQSFGGIATDPPPAFGTAVANSAFGASNTFQQPTVLPVATGQQPVFGASAFSSPPGFFQQPDVNAASNQFSSPDTGLVNRQGSVFGGSSASSVAFGGGGGSIFGGSNTVLGSDNSVAVTTAAQHATFPASKGVFSQPAQKDAGGVHTDISDLTAEEREQFETHHFSSGNIPLRPPPSELCI